MNHSITVHLYIYMLLWLISMPWPPLQRKKNLYENKGKCRRPRLLPWALQLLYLCWAALIISSSLAMVRLKKNRFLSVTLCLNIDIFSFCVILWLHGTGTLRPCTFRPHIICPCKLFPDVFTSLYVLSLNESQPTELHQPCIGWAFSLILPFPGYGQSQPTEFHQPMNWLGI